MRLLAPVRHQNSACRGSNRRTLCEVSNYAHHAFRSIALTLAALAVSASIWQTARSRPVTVGDGCGWDGVVYCAMTRGEVVMEPYSRRVLLPWVAGLVPVSSPVTAFQIINAFAIAGLVAAALWLLHTLIGREAELRGFAMLAAVSLVLLNPWTFHLYLTYPVLTDSVSAALALAWCAAALRRTRLADAGGAVVLVGMSLTREHWSLVAIAASWIAVVLGLRAWRWALGTSVIGLMAMMFAFGQPTNYAAGPLQTVVLHWINESLSSPSHLARFLFMVVAGIGFTALAPLLRARAVWSERPLLWVCVVALGNTAGSAFAGGDTDRILMPSGLLLMIVSIALVLRNMGLVAPWGLWVIGTIAIWHPFASAGPDGASWLAFYGLRVEPIEVVVTRIIDDLSAAALPVMLGVLLCLSRPGTWSRTGRTLPQAVDSGVPPDASRPVYAALRPPT